MLSDIRGFFGLTREIALTGQSTYFETAQSQHIVKELKLAIKDGKLIVLSGIVGTGKTTTLRKIQEALEEGKEILIAKALSVDGGEISLGTLILALFCDLVAAKDDPMPTQTEKRERALRMLIRKRKKPVALFIDDAHQLHSKTLISLKRLMEIVRDGKGRLSKLPPERTQELHNRLLAAGVLLTNVIPGRCNRAVCKKCGPIII